MLVNMAEVLLSLRSLFASPENLALTHLSCIHPVFSPVPSLLTHCVVLKLWSRPDIFIDTTQSDLWEARSSFMLVYIQSHFCGSKQMIHSYHKNRLNEGLQLNLLFLCASPSYRLLSTFYVMCFSFPSILVFYLRLFYIKFSFTSFLLCFALVFPAILCEYR